MNQSNSLTFPQIKMELSQLNFDRNAISILTNLINNAKSNLSHVRLSTNNQEINIDLDYLLDSLREIYTYREEQQISIFDQIISEFKNLLNEIET